jgi:hypothetical protein
VRMSARIVDPRRLDFIDVVSSSHNHATPSAGPLSGTLRNGADGDGLVRR